MTGMKKGTSLRALTLLVAILTAIGTAPPVWSASHREAPLIALDPAADNTDTYAFRSWVDPDKVVFILNTIPGQEPGDGPNYFNFDDNVLYRIHIDHDQDGVAEDIVYEFRFTTDIRSVLGLPLSYVGNPNIPVSGFQGITALDGPGSEGLALRQTYTVTEKRNGKKKGTQLFQGQTLVAVPSHVGPATMPDYEALAAQGIYSDGDTGIRVFAGQRAETFYIDLGAVFDTVNLRAAPILNDADDATDSANTFGVNRFSGFNIHSIVMEIPIDRLTVDGKPADDTTTPVIGMYASTSRHKMVKRIGAPKKVKEDTDLVQGRGRFVQVSRLANALFNELLIDTAVKDRWNASEPEEEAQFQEFPKNPAVAQALKLIFGIDVPPAPRTELLSLFLKYPGQGLDGEDCGEPCSELLRLDVSVSPALPENQKRLSVLAHDAAGIATPDPAGFPNGRRPNDDVPDIALRVVAGVLSGDPCCTGFPHNRLGDGVNFLEDAPGAGTSDGLGNYGNGGQLDVTPNGIAAEFPFLPTPHDGVNRRHIDPGE